MANTEKGTCRFCPAEVELNDAGMPVDESGWAARSDGELACPDHVNELMHEPQESAEE